MEFRLVIIALLSILAMACSKSSDPVNSGNVLSPPDNLLVKSGDGLVEISWNSQASASYTLYYSDQANIDPATCIPNNCSSIDNVDSPYPVSGLINQQLYYFIITKTENGEESGPSEEMTGIPLANAPNIVESGWSLVDAVAVINARAAHYNALDQRIYYVRRDTVAAEGGLYVIDENRIPTKIVAADRPGSMMVNNANGDIFLSEDFGGNIFHIPFGTTSRSVWVSGFRAGDDDPVGMAKVPTNYNGVLVSAGEVVVVDRGINSAGSGLDDVWKFSSTANDVTTPEVMIHDDNGTLIDAIDVAVNNNGIYIADTGLTATGGIFQLTDSATSPLVSIGQVILSSPVGIAVDPTNDELLVLEADTDVVARINPANGNTSTVVDNLTVTLGAWSGIDISPDGRTMVVTDDGAGMIYTFTRRIN